MSYDIRLVGKDGQVVQVPSFTDGGTYAVGGTTDADFNVTYNYSKHFDFRGLHERTGKDTIYEMQAALKRLGVVRDKDYWAATPGNAGAAVQRLLSFALLHPDATWEVS